MASTERQTSDSPTGAAGAQTRRILVSARIGAVSALAIRPSGARALLVFAHGAGAGMRHPFMERMAAAYAAQRLATLRYQFPYSEAGRQRPDLPPVLLATVRSALQHAVQWSPDLPVVLAGKSMGGRISGNFVAHDAPQEVQGLVFLGYPLHTAGKPAITRAVALRQVRVPMLFLQGSKDKLATPELLQRVCQELGPRSSLVMLDDADHGFAIPKRRNLGVEQMAALLAEHTLRWCEQIGIMR